MMDESIPHIAGIFSYVPVIVKRLHTASLHIIDRVSNKLALSCLEGKLTVFGRFQGFKGFKVAGYHHRL